VLAVRSLNTRSIMRSIWVLRRRVIILLFIRAIYEVERVRLCPLRILLSRFLARHFYYMSLHCLETFSI
jgi:hypothetical protein